MVVQCEKFCQNPCCVYEELLMKLGVSYNDAEDDGPKQFTPSRNRDVQNGNLIEKALSMFYVE